MVSLVDTLVTIPGPQFLWFYAGLIVVRIIVARWWGEERHFCRVSAAGTQQLDPLTIAALQGGPMAVVHRVVFDLWNRGLVEISGEKSKAQIVCCPAKEPPGGTIQEALCQANLETPRKLSALVRDKSFRTRIEGPLNVIQQRLEGLHLFQTAADRRESLAGIVRGPRGRDAGGWHQVVPRSVAQQTQHLFDNDDGYCSVYLVAGIETQSQPAHTALGQAISSIPAEAELMDEGCPREQPDAPGISPGPHGPGHFRHERPVGVAAFDQYQQAFAAFTGPSGDASWSGSSYFDSSSSSDGGGGSDGGGSDGGGGGCGGCGGGD